MAIFSSLYYFLALYYVFAMSALFMAYIKFGWIVLLIQDFGLSAVLMMLFACISATLICLIINVQRKLTGNRAMRILAGIVSLFFSSIVPMAVLLLLSPLCSAYVSVPLPSATVFAKIWALTFNAIWLGWFVLDLLFSFFIISEDDDLPTTDRTHSLRKVGAAKGRDAQQEIPEWYLLWALAKKRISDGNCFAANNLLLESLFLLEKEFNSTSVVPLEELFHLTHELALNQMRLGQFDLAKISLERALSLGERLPESAAKISFAEMMRKLDECRTRSRGEKQTDLN